MVNSKSKRERDEEKYKRMVERCELHNAQVETITRTATQEENKYYTKLLEQDKYKRKLSAKERARFYGSGYKNAEY